MVLFMPRPYRHPKTGMYWYRQRVPTDLAVIAKGKKATISLDGKTSVHTLTEVLQVSLRTKEQAAAKINAREAQEQFDLVWASFRASPAAFTRKQVMGLAGEVYRLFVADEDDPGTVEERLEAWMTAKGALAGQSLALNPLEHHFGRYLDAVLTQYGLAAPPETREDLLKEAAKAVQEGHRLLMLRAAGNYSPGLVSDQYPEFVPPESKAVPAKSGKSVTFAQVIEAEREFRALGKDAAPLAPKTITKYLSIASQFASFRGKGGTLATTTTSADLEAWKTHLQGLQGDDSVKNRTVAYKISAIKTILAWGKVRFKDNPSLVQAAIDANEVKLPSFTEKASDQSSIHPDEAPLVLRAAKDSIIPRLRWLPWICAYSGLRIGEAANLEKEDFLESEGFWFFKVSTTGGRSVKTQTSIRYMPVHPELIREGFRTFVTAAPRVRTQ